MLHSFCAMRHQIFLILACCAYFRCLLLTRITDDRKYLACIILFAVSLRMISTQNINVKQFQLQKLRLPIAERLWLKRWDQKRQWKSRSRHPELLDDERSLFIEGSPFEHWDFVDRRRQRGCMLCHAVMSDVFIHDIPELILRSHSWKLHVMTFCENGERNNLMHSVKITCDILR